jgi:hypothetical protein
MRVWCEMGVSSFVGSGDDDDDDDDDSSSPGGMRRAEAEAEEEGRSEIAERICGVVVRRTISIRAVESIEQRVYAGASVTR